jgi:outer membrane protein OmpA-like peptidoglycan-associated protein
VISLSSCGTKQRFESGQEAYKGKHYNTAKSMLQGELLKSRSKSEIFDKSFMIAESFKMMNLPDSAILWYTKSLKVADDEQAFLNLAKEYKKLENYTEAVAIVEKSISIFGNTEETIREKNIINQALNRINRKQQDIVINKLPINTKYSEFATDYFNNNLIISSDRQQRNKETYGWTGNFYYNVYKYDASISNNIDMQDIGLKSPFNISSICVVKDEAYYVKCGEKDVERGNCYVYSGQLIGDNLIEKEKLSFQKPGYNYRSPRLSPDEKRLYFASDMPGGFGGFDLYYCEKKDQIWSDPARLPNIINSPGHEDFITFYKKDIYFSSDFLSGLGGFDIFSTTIDSSGKYSPPANLPHPINSGGDDFYMIKVSDSLGYLSSSRYGGEGLDDIYRFQILPDLSIDTTTTKITESKTDTSASKKIKKIFLALKVQENVYSNPEDPNSKIIGKRAVPSAIIRFKENSDFLTDANGMYISQINFDTTLNITVGKDKYLTTKQLVEIDKEDEYNDDISTINLKITIDKLFLNTEIVLKNIYYDFNKWDLRPESENTLNILFNILKNNPEYEVNIGSHTDCRGDTEYNNELSQKRAQSVVDYLINKGITSERLIAVGYGESNLLINCGCEKCTEDQHQLNRRTTFELKN